MTLTDASTHTIVEQEHTPDADLVLMDQLIVEQEQIVVDRTPQSQALTKEAAASLAGGVASSWQDAPPGAVWISHGAGSRIWDVDGFEYTDVHGGFGVGLAGHAHPAIVDAVTRRVKLGTHFAQPTEDVIPVSRELARRFGLPLWRYNNSGTESTMDAFHLMRIATGRDKVIKVEGSYHGHHDSAQVSVYPEDGHTGPVERPASVRAAASIPQAVADLTVIVPFGNLEAVERVLVENRGEIAGMIVEPIMMNIGMIPPPPGYLQGLKDLLHAHGAYLTFDEVKTGFGVAPGGAIELSGVTPDIVCVAKAMGGGLPCGAIGAVPELMALVADKTYEQVGPSTETP